MSKKLIRFDWAMKKLLRHKANFGILEGFLSELLLFDVTIENILESEGNKEDQYDKYNRVDILVKSTEGELMLVEVQNDSEIDYFHRMLYGVSKLVTEYIKEGQPYGTIRKVYAINVVYFGLGQGKDYLYTSKNEFVGTHQGDILKPTIIQKSDYLVEKVSDIFPKYYILKVNNFDDVAKNTLDEWIYFLKNSEVKEGFKAKGLDEAKEKLRYESLSEVEKKRYVRFQEDLRIEKSVKYTAIAEAKMEGRLEGKKEGRLEGKLERDIEVARNAIKEGLDNQIIAKLTELTLEEIEKLQKDE